MDWITGIQSAIDYVEEHITEKPDFEAVAQRAYSSVFHFQRVFAMLTGYTLGDYIRMRRLTLAAEELAAADKRVIDTALKYGYDSHESFTRAFTRFHGVTPMQVRRGAGIKSFTRLSVKLILTGGTTMDYRIEKKDAFSVLCKRKKVTKPENATATEEISSFWQQCGADGTLNRICERFPEKPSMKGLLGICFSQDLENKMFPYGIGVEYDEKGTADEGLEIIEIPAHTYAVFPCRGRMPDAFAAMYHKICTEFFPQNSMYEYGSGIELEVYPSDDVTNPDYYCEIWIAVNEKSK